MIRDVWRGPTRSNIPTETIRSNCPSPANEKRLSYKEPCGARVLQGGWRSRVAVNVRVRHACRWVRSDGLKPERKPYAATKSCCDKLKAAAAIWLSFRN